MRVHQQTVYWDLPKLERGESGHRSFSLALGAKWLTYLGAISFPIYILHGPMGQIFYKRAVASKLFNGVVMTKYPEFFPVYLLIVLVAAVATHELFMKNKDAQGWFQEGTGAGGQVLNPRKRRSSFEGEEKGRAASRAYARSWCCAPRLVFLSNTAIANATKSAETRRPPVPAREAAIYSSSSCSAMLK